MSHNEISTEKETIEAGLKDDFCTTVRASLEERWSKVSGHLDWLLETMPPYFFITMKDERAAMANLALRLHEVPRHRKITLTDKPEKLVLARLDVPGSLYDTLKDLQEREISYAELVHSYAPMPAAEHALEIQRFEFQRKTAEAVQDSKQVRIPRNIERAVYEIMKTTYPAFEFDELREILRLLWINNSAYVMSSPPERVARVAWLFQQGKKNEGLYLDVEQTEVMCENKESRILFAVENPPHKGFMTQISEVFQRLHTGVQRFYSLFIMTGSDSYLLGTFYISAKEGCSLERESELFQKIRSELYNTQIISTERSTYRVFVTEGILTGEEASLTNALVSFCHTSLAHNRPDRFDWETVKSAFQADPNTTLKILEVFKKRFDPEAANRDEVYGKALDEAMQIIDGYNTGHRYLDEIRTTIFRTCLLFIRHTLKTNFFVPEKRALAFRLDPAYLAELGPEFTSDLPPATPFRITFFSSRDGVGYHVGFSDIARGGWRTNICRSRDEYTTNTDTLFREVFVLAYTQHLKNKDIYEGGSKMTVVLDAEGSESEEIIVQRLYKLQYSFINAFLDIFVTSDGKAVNPRVLDYYREDEPIELGPDENMHDIMIERIARQSVKRGYILGIGIMSSKRVGINHKAYGVTSRGLMKFAEIAMREQGINLFEDPFTVKMTGGTNGDVAGNAIKLLLDRCPGAGIQSIAAGTGVLYDPEGLDRKELGRRVLKDDVVDFDPEALHAGGFMLFRREYRQEGMRRLHRKIIRTDAGVEEQWITVDEFNREFDDLIFSRPADLFLPCGGRPETIDGHTWQRLFDKTGRPTARVIVEGANAFITPDAREEIQKKGVVIIRDASANKCGVISSSYEIIANLLMTEKEFLAHKEPYVKDVLNILEDRAREEAELIFRRHEESQGRALYTAITNTISREINDHYAKLFVFFQDNGDLVKKPLYRKVLLSHLPPMLLEYPKFRRRVGRLPQKIKCAVLACVISRSIVYHGGWEADFEGRLSRYLKEAFS